MRSIIIAGTAALLFACSQEQAPQLRSDGVCQPPRPQICTMQFDPVCSEHDGQLQQYSNACSACSDPQVETYQHGACPE